MRFPQCLPAFLSLALLVLAGCDRDPEVAKRKYLDKGNRYFQRGSYREASLMYRNALAKDFKFGEAYYRLALADMRMMNMSSAVRNLRMARNLMPDGPERLDAKVKLADLYLEFALEGADSFLSGVDLTEEREVVEVTARELIRRDPKSFDGHRMQANLAILDFRKAARDRDKAPAKKLLDEAIAEFEKADQVKPLQPNLVLSMARSLMMAGRPDEAEKRYRQVIGRNKHAVQIYADLSRLCMSLKRPAEAESTLIEGIRENPKTLSLSLRLATLYHDLNRDADAARILQQMKASAESGAEAAQWVGDYYYGVGNYPEAIRQYEEGIRNFPKETAQYRKRIIEVMAAQGRFVEAIPLADTLVRENPTDPDAISVKASLLSSRSELDASLPAMENILKKVPDHPLLRFNLGRTYALRGDWEAARVHFTEALRLRPDYMQASVALGEVLFATDKYELALQSAQEVLDKNPRNRIASALQFRSLVKLGRGPEARKTLAAAIAADPKSADPYYQLGALNLTEKKYEQAEQAFRDCYRVDPEDTRPVEGVIQALEGRNRFDLAAAFLRQEIARHPERRELRRLLARAATRARNYQVAIAEYTALLASWKGNAAAAARIAEVEVALGEAYRLNGQAELAIQTLEKARLARPDDPAIWMNLGKILDGMGRKQKARECYEQTLKIEPDNVIALNDLAFLMAESGGDLDKALTYAQRARQIMPNVDEVADTIGWIYLKKRLSKSAIEILEPLTARQPGRAVYRYHLAAAFLAVGDKPRARQELQIALKSNPSTEEAAKIRELIGQT